METNNGVLKRTITTNMADYYGGFFFIPLFYVSSWLLYHCILLVLNIVFCSSIFFISGSRPPNIVMYEHIQKMALYNCYLTRAISISDPASVSVSDTLFSYFLLHLHND